MTITWTKRHEAKFSFFTDRLSNFSLSLANNFQRWMCYKMALGKLVSDSIECGPPRLGNGRSLVQDKHQHEILSTFMKITRVIKFKNKTKFNTNIINVLLFTFMKI